MDYSDEAISTFLAALGWALENLDRVPPEGRTASWLLNRVYEGVEAQQATGMLLSHDAAAVFQLHSLAVVNFRSWAQEDDSLFNLC